MKSVLNFFRQNKTASAVILALVAVVVIAGLISGCSLGSFIKHKVPSDMREFNDNQSMVSLDDAPFVMEDYVDSVERNIRQFTEANEKAHLIFDFVNSAVTVGVEELGNSPIPGAAMISGVLLGVAGLMTRKPGTAREMADEKMASFNAGQEKAVSQLQSLISPDALRELLSKLRESD